MSKEPEDRAPSHIDLLKSANRINRKLDMGIPEPEQAAVEPPKEESKGKGGKGKGKAPEAPKAPETAPAAPVATGNGWEPPKV